MVHSPGAMDEAMDTKACAPAMLSLLFVWSLLECERPYRTGRSLNFERCEMVGVCVLGSRHTPLALRYLYLSQCRGDLTNPTLALLDPGFAP